MKKHWMILGTMVLGAILTLGAVFTVGATFKQAEEYYQPESEVKESYAYLYGSQLVTVTPLSEAAAKALEWQVGDLSTWIDGIVLQRADDAVKEMIVRILVDDKDDFYLTKEEKDKFGQDCSNAGLYLVDVDNIPDNLKAQLIMSARTQ